MIDSILQELSSSLPLPLTDEIHTEKYIQNTVAQILIQRHHVGSSVNKFSKEILSQMLKNLKPQVLVHLLDTLQIEQCMVFCRTNLDCDLLEKFLLQAGGGQREGGSLNKKETGKENLYSCCVLAGMRSMEQRRLALESFKEGDIRILICTDVAARGIDIKNLSCIINMILPDMEENYIHRVGRVGRSDCMGLAVSIVAAHQVDEKVWYHKCNKPRGKGCSNRNLLDQGGCTIWYKENEIKAQIEKKLGEQIETFETIQSLVQHIQKSGGMKQYGLKKQSMKGQMSKELSMLAPVVRNLAHLEEQVQHSWLQLNEFLR
jgi:ATP-dependent RNA helicase DDX1